MSSGEDATPGLLNKSSIVTSLHAILKPFLLRRLKVDVEKELPPKKEYLLYAPLTQQQKDIYQAIVSGQIRQFLVDKRSSTEHEEKPELPELEQPAILEDDAPRRSRKKARVNYKIEENDNKYIKALENGTLKDEPSGVEPERSAAEIGKEWQLKQASKSASMLQMDRADTLGVAKHVNNMKLQNLVMQLRKISSHPFLFDWTYDPKTNQLVVNEDLVNASGKMLLLNRLLDALFEKGHKVLLFSQFTTMLDVIVSAQLQSVLPGPGEKLS